MPSQTRHNRPWICETFHKSKRRIAITLNGDRTILFEQLCVRIGRCQNGDVVAIAQRMSQIKNESRLRIRGKAWQGRGSEEKFLHRLPKFEKIIFDHIIKTSGRRSLDRKVPERQNYTAIPIHNHDLENKPAGRTITTRKSPTCIHKPAYFKRLRSLLPARFTSPATTEVFAVEIRGAPKSTSTSTSPTTWIGRLRPGFINHQRPT